MTADGQPACTPAGTLRPAEPLAVDALDASIARALASVLGRRTLLRAAAGGVAALMLAACQAPSSGAPTSATATTGGAPTTPAAPAPSAAAPTSAAAASTAGAASTSSAAARVYVFNTGSQDVSVIDSATNKVVATRPLGAAVRWLSNEQTYWDGSRVWTYDFPNNQLHAIAIDPQEIKVVQTIETGTTGPGHSLMLTPDKQTAWLNAAGSNVLNVIDLKTGQVADKVATGQFP
jgi:YVTN family beta-propeller protein